jgi:hypothetical protein
MNIYDRQSFLGAHSEKTLAATTVGLIGLGGGGSHVVQQLAHMGVGGFIVVDDDIIEDTNLNRLVNGTIDDVKNKLLKVDIAARTIRGLVAKPRLKIHAKKWQEVADQLKACDIIIGGLDSVVAKDQLDAFCKRFLIPYIDMGMDVHAVGDSFLIAGQVALTSPGGPCLRCMGIVTEEAVIAEQKRYGAAGGKPQVVWPNGVLASTAVGLFTQLVCAWHKKPVETAYLEYDGNKHTVTTSRRLDVLHGRECEHHPKNETGEPGFDIRNAWQPIAQVKQAEEALKKGWGHRMIAWLTPR